MINGINLNDLSNSQVTFQPSINTVSEFKVDNSTFSAEYGRNSGAIVNVATRSGANAFHGEGFEFYRDDTFDSRNYFNPEPNPKSPFNRKQFGFNLGGPIVKNKTFFFYSYEGLRQVQGVDLNAGVLTDAQRAAVTDPVAKRLLQYIPLGNTTDATGQARLLASDIAPVNIDQHTVDMRHTLGQNDDLHGYYAYQKDLRQEPNAQGNTVPGFGDTRGGKRQIMTLNETHIFSQALVNEARVGYNRININFAPNVVVNPSDLGINDGINFPIALPQISITALGLNIGGPAGFPQGRTVQTLGRLGHGDLSARQPHHQVRRRVPALDVSTFTDDPGTFTYATRGGVPGRARQRLQHHARRSRGRPAHQHDGRRSCRTASSLGSQREARSSACATTTSARRPSRTTRLCCSIRRRTRSSGSGRASTSRTRTAATSSRASA